uniref:Uncharacterized protein n=1 Tax=Anguilla anguilla TaxID=7936 RepID=A0A0E9W6Y6_ANGAN
MHVCRTCKYKPLPYISIIYIKISFKCQKKKKKAKLHSCTKAHICPRP